MASMVGFARDGGSPALRRRRRFAVLLMASSPLSPAREEQWLDRVTVGREGEPVDDGGIAELHKGWV